MFNAVQASLHTHTQLRYLSLLFPLSRGGSSPSLFLRSWLHLFACGWNSCCRGWGFWVHSTGALLPVMLILGTAATLHAEKLQQNFIAGPLLVSCFGNKELHTWMCRKRGFQSSGWMWYIAQWKSVSALPSLKEGKTVSKILPMGHSQSAHWLLYKDHFSSRQASCQAHTKSEPEENSADYCYCHHFYKKIIIYVCVFIYLANLIHTFWFILQNPVVP